VRFAASHGNLAAFRAPYQGDQPALLVSGAFPDSVAEVASGRIVCRDWVLDSGAYTAFNAGKPVVLSEYIEAIRRLRDTPCPPSEVFSLDVIGDWRAGMANTEAMWAAGIECIPCFHQGEPEDVLIGMARDYPKIALGNMVGLRSKPKLRWARRCLDRVWPKRVHGFGLGSEEAIMSLPFESLDATNWHINPAGFGQWRYLGSTRKKWGKGSWRGSGQNLRAEVQWYLDLERRARERWASTWQGVEGQV